MGGKKKRRGELKEGEKNGLVAGGWGTEEGHDE